MRDEFCYFNGEILRFIDIKISPYDLAFVRGYGIFDAMRTANGAPFCFKAHWEKFKKSAQELDLILPIGESEFENIIKKLQEKNNLKDIAIKTILTGGESEDGFNRLDKPTFLILVSDLKKIIIPDNQYEKGWKLMSLDYQRCLPEIKNLNYLVPLKNQKIKVSVDANEIVYKNNGNILECSTSNIFAIKDGIIITPKNNIFLGTTRNLVIDLALKNNFKVVERDLPVEYFLSADEVFLTATYKKIMPVVAVDEKRIGDGRVGSLTKKLITILDEFIKNYS